MSKELEAIIRISGELDSSVKKAVSSVSDKLEQMEAAAKKAGGASVDLASKISEQSTELRAAKTLYASYVLNGEEASDQAKELADRIQKLSRELGENESALQGAFNAAERLADGMEDAAEESEDLGDSAKKTKGGFTVMKGAISNLISAGIQKLISASGDAVRALFDLAEQTREFRQDMSTLETAYDSAGFSAEAATATWKDLYAVFGEDDRAVEAANNISRMAKSQEDLDKWVKITTGVWGSYQDALPVEGLAESAGETAKVGKVTGVFADALNWSSEAATMFAKYMSDDVTNAEDAFNVALSKCANEQERQALITETLTALYGDAADKYNETSSAQMDAKRATAEYMLAQAQLAESMEPLNTAWTNMKTTLLNAVAPALQVVSEKLQGALEWMQQHPGAMKVIVSVLAVLVAGITAVTVAVAIYTGIQMLANAAMLPVIGIALAIVAAIAAVVAIGVALYNNWDTIKAKAAELGAAISAKFSEIRATISNIWSGIVSYLSSVWSSIRAKASSFVSGVRSVISSGWSALTNILTAPFRALASFIDNVFGKIKGLAGKISSIKTSISSIKIPFFAAGGFTSGPSIAGEAGTEAVISFDPRYRSENMAYWAEAGRMLGMDDSFSLSGGSSSTYVDLGGVNFAPNIVVKGNAKKEDIVAAIRESYPEFMDMLDELISEREATVYA